MFKNNLSKITIWFILPYSLNPEHCRIPSLLFRIPNMAHWAIFAQGQIRHITQPLTITLTHVREGLCKMRLGQLSLEYRKYHVDKNAKMSKYLVLSGSKIYHGAFDSTKIPHIPTVLICISFLSYKFGLIRLNYWNS